MKSRSLVTQIAGYGLVPIFARMCGVITAPLLTQSLSVSDYGVIDLLGSVVAAIALLIAINAISGFFREFYECDEKSQRRLFSSVFWFYLFISSLVLILVLVFHGFFARVVLEDLSLRFLLLLALFKLPFVLIQEIAFALLRIKKEVFLYASLSVLLAFVNVLAVVVLFYSNLLDVENLLISQLVLAFVATVVVVYCIKSSILFHFDWSMFSLVMRYSIPQFPSVVINFLLIGAMPIIISKLIGIEAVGIYGIANKIAAIFFILPQTMRMALQPLYMESMALGEESVQEFIKSAHLLYLSLGAALLIFVSFISPFLFSMFIDSSFHEAMSVVWLICCANFVFGFNNYITANISYNKKTKYISFSQVIVVSIFFSLVFVFKEGLTLYQILLFFMSSSLIQMASYFFFDRMVGVIRFNLVCSVLYIGFIFCYFYFELSLLFGVIICVISTVSFFRSDLVKGNLPFLYSFFRRGQL